MADTKKIVKCGGHDGLGGCDHLTEVSAHWEHFTAYCSMGCFLNDECDTPEKCAGLVRGAADD